MNEFNFKMEVHKLNVSYDSGQNQEASPNKQTYLNGLRRESSVRGLDNLICICLFIYLRGTGHVNEHQYKNARCNDGVSKNANLHPKPLSR